MTKFLKDLLGNDHPLFSININEMERATGHAGVDTRLIADITEKAHEVMRLLKLDPADTTGEELYTALKNTVSSSQAGSILSGSDYVLINLGSGPVSFNLQDVIENAHHELGYQKRTVAHAQRHLRMEVIKRYADHDRTDNEIIHKLAEQIDLKRPNDKEHPVIEKIADPSAPYLLAVGDIVTDAFILLRDDQAEVHKDENGTKRLSMEFGSKLPYEQVDIVQAVGNSANAAVSFSRLGLRAGLMAFVGDDQAGKDSLRYLASENVTTDTVSVQKGFKSNYHYALRYGAERTILIKYEDYEYTWQHPQETPDWLYLSMLSKTSWGMHEDMLTYLNDNPSVKLAFQPGTFHFEWGVEKLERIYQRSYIVFMNREEAVQVTGKSYDSIPDLINGLHDLGPKVVVVTDGADGAYASDGEKMFVMPNYPDPAPPYDRTGAGDAFSSTITAALAMGESLEIALTWAPINSMSVVQKLGAQEGLVSKKELLGYLEHAPEDYKIKELE